MVYVLWSRRASEASLQIFYYHCSSQKSRWGVFPIFVPTPLSLSLWVITIAVGVNGVFWLCFDFFPSFICPFLFCHLHFQISWICSHTCSVAVSLFLSIRLYLSVAASLPFIWRQNTKNRYLCSLLRFWTSQRLSTDYTRTSLPTFQWCPLAKATTLLFSNLVPVYQHSDSNFNVRSFLNSFCLSTSYQHFPTVQNSVQNTNSSHSYNPYCLHLSVLICKMGVGRKLASHWCCARRVCGKDQYIPL